MSWLKTLNLFKKNDSGFTLAEVMIAAGMVAVISVTLMRVMSSATKSSKKITTDMAISETHADIRGILRNEGACNALFKGKNISVFQRSIKDDPILASQKIQSITRFRAATAEDDPVYNVWAVNSAAIGEGTPTRFWIDQMVGSDAKPSAGLQAYEFMFNIYYLRIDPTKTADAQKKLKKNTIYGGTTKRMSFKINVNVSGTGEIEKCNADLAQYQKDMCETALDGIFNETTQKCTGIMARDPVPTIDKPRKVSLEADSQYIETGVQIGSGAGINAAVAGLGINTSATGAGNIDMTGNIVMAGNIVAAGSARIDKSLGVNVNPVAGNGDIDLSGNIASTGALNIYSDRANPTTTSRIEMAAAKVTVQSATDINGVANISSGSPGVLSLTTTGNIHIKGTMGTVQYPLSAAYNPKYAATREWVEAYMTHGIAENAATSSLIGEVIDTMANYVNNEPMNAVAQFTCAKMSTRNLKGAVGSRSGCTFTVPNCDLAGRCTKVCIGNDCRTAWPVDTTIPDTKCTSGTYCSSVCIRNVCRTSWPTFRSNYACRRTSYTCANNEVMHGLYYSYSTARPICCRLIIR